VELAKGAYAEVRIALAEVIGTGAATPAEPLGDLKVDSSELPSLEILVSSALANREDLLAFRREEEEAQAQVALERSLARPNLVARVFQRREGTEDISGAGLAMGIPLFNRNRGGIAAARAAADRAAAETAVARLAVEREVASALAVYRAAGAAAEGLRGQVIGNLEENLRLLQRSFEEGKIGRGDLLLFRREFVDSQREYLDAVNQAWQARVRLDLATGRLQIGQPLNRSPE
jgi:cobalt-zinc-cadmium efflux system outer membrane protein